MDVRERSSQLKSWALEEGFDRAGVCRLEPSAHGEAYRRWLARGDAAGMAYLERRVDERIDPRRLLPGARAALSVAWRYWPIDGESRRGDLWSGVARYARGRDYHDVMTRRLRRLNDRIEASFPGSTGRWYVDTGPVLERELAARAGLGAIGKNTNLLSPEIGSWFLLGEILLTLDLEPDSEVSDLCGSCTACLEACPTGALPEPFRLDSNRCISYWTIEHRGSIPLEMRDELGGWVFGCDVCQEVCPINHESTGVEPADPPAGAALRLPPERQELGLVELLGLSREEYVERFRGSPMKRAKRPGLQRNAAVAMGNSGDRRYVEALAGALSDESAVVRSHAAWALGQLGGRWAREELERAAESEDDADTRREMVRAGAALGGSKDSG